MTALSTERAQELPLHELGERTGQRFPLSFAQERLWFLERLGSSGAAYNVPLALSLRGSLDCGALQATFFEVIRRHESLRTRIEETADGPVQVILDARPSPIDVTDLSALEFSQQEVAVARAVREERTTPFVISRESLLRVRLLKLSAQDHVLLITMHHMVSDWWSVDILMRELRTLYRAFKDRHPSPLKALEIQYADYAVWQRRWLQGGPLEQQLGYWRQQLQGAPAALELPTDTPRPIMMSHKGGAVPFFLPAGILRQLASLCKSQRGVTPFMLFLAAFQVLLYRWTGCEDIVVGTPIAGRRNVQTEGLIGFFVNMLALRSRIDPTMSFREFLPKVRDMALDAYSAQDVPFASVVADLRPPRDPARHPIFQVTFSWQDQPQQDLELAELELSPLPSEASAIKYDLSVFLQTEEDGIHGNFEFATDIFNRDSIARLTSHFGVLLEAIADAPDRPLSEYALLTNAEREQLLHSFNATQEQYPSGHQLIHELFERQARERPDAVAVFFEGDQLSYSQLNRQANRVAHRLLKLGIRPDDRIALCVDRSLEMVIGLLGILKAGAAYVPLDPSYPPERLNFMLQDSAPAALLTQRHLPHAEMFGAAVEADEISVLLLDDPTEWIDHPERNPVPSELGLTPRHLAYVIYTSGSTGKPKGVMNEHRGVMNRLLWAQARYQLGAGDRVLQKTPLSFDVSAWEVFWPLIAGAPVVIARPAGHLDPHYLAEVISSARITTVHFVPSMLDIFLEHAHTADCTSLVRVICSGEALSGNLQSRFHEYFPTVSLHNLYGPTEAAIDVTSWDCTTLRDPVPIGRPIANTQIHILDRHGELVPLGVTGEIHIGGLGVARGYLNRPELTNERFVADPFGQDPDSRLYRTGDLGRWQPDGFIEYLGRNDHQVKLRGFRIELGEIEAQLRRDPDVREAVVVAHTAPGVDKQLVAYVVAHEGVELQVQTLRSELASALPDYMVPAAIVILPAMPLSVNGKLDIPALPPPEHTAYVQTAYEPALGPIEQQLLEIWQTLLNIERIGRHDNFFELGGHSLLTTKLVRVVHDRLNVELPVWTVFESPSIAALAQRVEEASLALPAAEAEPGLPGAVEVGVL